MNILIALPIVLGAVTVVSYALLFTAIRSRVRDQHAAAPEYWRAGYEGWLDDTFAGAIVTNSDLIIGRIQSARQQLFYGLLLHTVGYAVAIASVAFLRMALVPADGTGPYILLFGIPATSMWSPIALQLYRLSEVRFSRFEEIARRQDVGRSLS